VVGAALQLALLGGALSQYRDLVSVFFDLVVGGGGGLDLMRRTIRKCQTPLQITSRLIILIRNRQLLVMIWNWGALPERRGLAACIEM